MGFTIESIQNREMYLAALKIDANTEKLKEYGYEDEEISELIAGSKGNANGEIDTEEEIAEFKYKIETLIADKEAELAQETSFAKETSKFCGKIGGVLGAGLGLVATLALKKLRISPLLGLMGGGVAGLALGSAVGANKAQKLNNENPNVADLQAEITELKDEYRKFELNYR